jgi:hypothetical protein
MGGTTIVCGVKAEIAEPDLENLDEGFLGELLFTQLLFLFLSLTLAWVVANSWL